MWDAPEDDGGAIDEYRVRLYSGSSYYSASGSERLVISSTDMWAIPHRLPSRRPVRAVVRVFIALVSVHDVQYKLTPVVMGVMKTC